MPQQDLQAAPSRDQQLAYETLRQLAEDVRLPDPLRAYLYYLTIEKERAVYHRILLPHLSKSQWRIDSLLSGEYILYWDDFVSAWRAQQLSEISDADAAERIHRIRVTSDPRLFEFNGDRDKEHETGAWDTGSWNTLSEDQAEAITHTYIAVTMIRRCASSYYFEESARRTPAGETDDIGLAYEAGTRSAEIDAALGRDMAQNHPAGARYTGLTENLMHLPVHLLGRPIISAWRVAQDHFAQLIEGGI